MTNSETIIFQSALNQGKPFQQLSNLVLTGLNTKTSFLNSDCGRLYGTLTSAGGVYTLNLYKDVLKSQLVATAGSSALGQAAVTGANGSGLSGSVNIAQYVVNDPAIQVIALLSVDDDIQFNNLQTLSDYDLTVGFASFHLDAFSELKNTLMSRYKPQVFDPYYIDSNNLNGVTGGYNFSRILNWHTEDFKMWSSFYALAKICERTAVCTYNNSFYGRAKDCRDRTKAYLESMEVRFDFNQDRVEDTSKSTRTWRILRS